MHQLLSIKQLSSLLCLLLFSALFTSCIKDDFEFDKLTSTQWNPSLAIPLVNSSMLLEDFIPEDDNLITNSNNELILIYETLYESDYASEIYPIADQNFNQSIDFPGLPSGTPVDSGTVVIDTTMVLNFNAPAGMEIDSILHKDGQWNFSFSSTFRQSGSLQIIIRDATFNGVPFSSTIPFNYTGSTPINNNASYNLSNYLFDLTRQGSTFNEIEVRYILTLENNGNSYSSGDNISVNQSIDGIEFKETYGYFGQQFISADSDTIDFSVFQNDFQYASLSLTNPSLQIDIHNSFGMPIEAQLNQFSTYNDQTGYTNISGPGLPNPIFVISPDVSQMGQTLLTSLNINNTNSNIETAINGQPDAFLYNSSGLTNPAGRVDKNFILDNSQLTANYKFELPLEGMFDRLTFNDSMDFSLEAIDEIEAITLLTNIDNEFPMDFEIQLLFMDDNNLILDSLTNNTLILIDAAPVDASGIVTSKSNKKNEIVVPESKVQNITNATKVVMRATTTTFSNGTVPVKLRSDYSLDIKIGALVTLKMDI